MFSMQNVNQQLLGMLQEYQQLKCHVDQLDYKVHPVKLRNKFPRQPNSKSKEWI